MRGPTVVAFWLPASDTLAGGEGPDLLEEFRAYTARVAPALEDAEIALVATAADSIVVELEGGPGRVISLRGLDYPFGYVLVQPGYAETILTGISTDDELLDEVTWYFGLDEADPDSLHRRAVSAPAPRARLRRATLARTAYEGRQYWAAGCHAGESRHQCTQRRASAPSRPQHSVTDTFQNPPSQPPPRVFSRGTVVQPHSPRRRFPEAI